MISLHKKLAIPFALTLLGLTACNGSDQSQQAAGSVVNSTSTNQNTNQNGSTNPSPSPSPSQKPIRNYSTDVMIFNGSGTWGEEITSLQNILKSHGTSYQLVNSAQLDAMSLDDMAKFGLMIFPGGSGGTQAGSLSSDTHARLRAAVQERGVSYLGFCAGTFIAVAPAPAPGKDVSYGLGIVDGPVLDYYYLENQLNPDIAMTMETFADGSKHDLVWYGGPVTLNTPGTVVAKYPNGDPAISETWSGNGFVMLSGVHPAATQATRDAYGLNDSDGLDFDLAWTLINSALTQSPLPVF